MHKFVSKLTDMKSRRHLIWGRWTAVALAGLLGCFFLVAFANQLAMGEEKPLSLTNANSVAPGVEPLSVEAIIPPGGSMTVAKKVCTPEVLPNPDIYFLADNTGSMTPVIAQVQTDAQGVLNAILAADPDARFGAGYYRDFPYDAAAYFNQRSINADENLTIAAINDWIAGGGSDGSEGQFFALDQIAEDAAGWSSDPTRSRILVWFGDAPAHDPVCSAISGLGYDIDEALVTQKLSDGKIRVVAISTTTGFYPNGLNDDPTTSASDYSGYCTINGSSGQAGRIADVYLQNVPAEDISQAILDGISALPAVVSWEVECDDGLEVTLSPESVEVTSGECANFSETIEVTLDPELACGQELTCTVKFLIDGEQPEEGFEQDIVITVPDVVPPEHECIETVNPHGNNVPPAGSTTLPGPKGGQNEDGFYQLLATDNCDEPEALDIFVVDLGSGTVFGPFAVGNNIKYTQAPGAVPESKKMGSDKGQAGAIAAHIIGNGDMAIYAVDTSGNKSNLVSCLVPPPPK